LKTFVALAALVLLTPGPALADDASRFALSVGAAAQSGGGKDLDEVGLHLGGEMAFHLGLAGPVLTLDVDRFASADPTLISTTFVSMGAGVRVFLARPKLPVGAFACAQGVVLGSTNPVNDRQSFLGGQAGVGLEWLGPLLVAGAVRYTRTASGPELLTFSLTIALGAS